MSIQTKLPFAIRQTSQSEYIDRTVFWKKQGHEYVANVRDLIRGTRSEERIYGELLTPFTYIGMRNPMNQDDYENLFYELASFSLSDEIKLRSRNGWIKKYSKFFKNPIDIDKRKIKEMAAEAANTQDLRLELALMDSENYTDRIFMELINYMGMIVGYSIRVPREFEDAVELEIRDKRDWSHMYAIWTPEDFKPTMQNGRKTSVDIEIGKMQERVFPLVTLGEVFKNGCIDQVIYDFLYRTNADPKKVAYAIALVTKETEQQFIETGFILTSEQFIENLLDKLDSIN